jgi:CHASE2 domain-containing sensor protein/signal transduction histidine kinase
MNTKPSLMSRWRYSAFSLALFTLLLTLLVLWLGALAPFRGYIYDPLLRLSVALQHKTDHVLLIHEDRLQNRTADEYVRLLSLLQSFEPTRIVFNFTPFFEGSRFYEAAREQENLFLGREVKRGSQGVFLESVPDDVQAVPFGVVVYPPEENGVYRRQMFTVQIGDRVYPTVEGVGFADTETIQKAGVRGDGFLINFQGSAGSVPNFYVDQVLNGELVENLVRNKTVLIGKHHEGLSFGLQTPTTTVSAPMLFSEFQAHAMQSLWNGRAIFEIDRIYQVVLLCLFVFLSSFIYQMLDSKFILLFTFLFIVFYLAAAFLVLHWFSVWIPITSILFAQFILMGLVHYQKLETVGENLEEISTQLSTQAQEHYDMANVGTDEHYWQYIIQSFNQMVDLEGVILLERKENSFYISEIASLNCPLDTIQELRRDIRREPYRSAIQRKKMVRVEGYFKNAEPDENHYLLPIMFGGNVYGFAAMVVSAENDTRSSSFENVVETFSDQLGELLYEYQLYKKSQKQAPFFFRFFTYEHFQTAMNDVRELTSLMHDRSLKLHALYNHLHLSFIVFDFFGRLQLVNQPMLDFLNKLNLSPYKVSAFEILSTVSQLDLDRTRKLFRDVIIERHPVSFTIRPDNQKHYRLLLRPLESDDRFLIQDVRAFGLWGIMLEIADVTEQHSSLQLKGLLSMEVGSKLRNALSAIQMSAQMMSDSDEPVEKAKMMSAIEHRVQDIVRFLKTSEEWVGIEMDPQTMHRFPIDGLKEFESVLDALAEPMRERQLRFNVEKPQIMNFVYASQSHLAKVFSFILELVMADASEESEIIIRIEEEKRSVNFYFANRGFGLPKEQFKDYLDSKEAAQSPVSVKIQEMTSWVEHWGGSLTLNSEVGVGTRINLVLVSFT